MKRSDLPYLDDLRAFDATARTGSVRAAAEELSLTHAAVSRRVSRLSEAVGAPLLERDGRGIRLTGAGEALSDTCRRSFDDLTRTIATIREAQQEGPGAVLLSCERSVAMRWLIPRLAAFEAAHPEIAIHLSVGGGAMDPHRDAGILALRRLDFPLDPAWTVRPLFPERVGPVMTAAMHARFTAGDYNALISRTRPDAWDSWLADHPNAPRPKDRRELDHHFLVAEAASSGLGVGLLPEVVALDDIARDRLVAPYGFSADGSRYALIHQGALSAEAEVLVGWLEEVSREVSEDGLK
ncbi:LysR family transcriptional regulator [Labrenzia sp. VG12]|uniref:LysR family transcriptional regulator n=1 Tax=Labrenzia sp. VG12 TaxID=2021862 RepID=UPI000B8C182C|nr:LysR family transcriptional regulator [Labrenzia sp. VG12]ASP33678.1 transcriptional regulator [Labrenzia sp. VG12]